MAIKFDAATSNNLTTGTSKTFAHTCTGTDRGLFVGIATDADNITGVTYNSVAMTQIGKSSSGSGIAYIYYLVAPATGSNNVVVSASASTDIYAAAVSYAGVSQSMTYVTNPTDAVDTTVLSAGGTDSTKSVTTISDCSIALAMYTHQRTITITSGTQRATGNTTDTKAQMIETAAAKDPVGSTSVTGSHTSAGATMAALIASISPATSVPTKSIDLELSSSQYLTAADSTSLSITGDLTAEFWVNFETLPENTTDTLSKPVGKWSAANQLSWQILFFDTNGSIRFYQSPDGTEVNFTDVVDLGTFVTGTWYHIAVSYNSAGASASFYLNGKLVSSNVGTGATALSSGIFNSTSIFEVGADSVNNRYYLDGKMKNIRIWNDVRTAEEISGNMYKQLIGSEQGLAAQWNLDDSLTDSTVNNNTLTAFNSPVYSTTIPFGFAPSRIGAITNSTHASSSSSWTVSHTVPATGSNKALILLPICGDNTLTMTATYNGTSMTEIYHRDATQRQDLYGFFLANPTVGVHDIVITFSSAVTNKALCAFTLQDVVQSSPTDGTNGTGVSATSASASVTSGSNGDLYLVQMVQNGGSAWVDDGSQGRLATTAAFSGSDNFIVSELPQLTAGAQSMGYTWTTSGGTDLSVITLKYQGAVTSSIKTVNGLAIASVKTKNGLAVASMKTLNGLSNV